jgi:hypothetical protein
MNSHEFAKRLLELPDLPLVVGDAEYAYELTEPVEAPNANGDRLMVTGMGSPRGIFPPISNERIA